MKRKIIAYLFIIGLVVAEAVCGFILMGKKQLSELEQGGQIANNIKPKSTINLNVREVSAQEQPVDEKKVIMNQPIGNKTKVIQENVNGSSQIRETDKIIKENVIGNQIKVYGKYKNKVFQSIIQISEDKDDVQIEYSKDEVKGELDYSVPYIEVDIDACLEEIQNNEEIKDLVTKEELMKIDSKQSGLTLVKKVVKRAKEAGWLKVLYVGNTMLKHVKSNMNKLEMASILIENKNAFTN